MEIDRKLKILYTSAYQFIQNHIGKSELDKRLSHYRGDYKVETMEDVFWQLLTSLTNKRGMTRTIGDIDALGPFLFEFNPALAQEHYKNWEKLFRVIKENYTPPGRMNEDGYWGVFVKGAVSGARFLSQFKSFRAFDKFVDNFSANDISLGGLPILIEQEIYGMGFPLACDFLKEAGYKRYSKPDIHLKTIFYECGIVGGYDDYDVFKAVVSMARVCGELPVVVDSILWLIGSERLRDVFIEEMRGRLG
jgi:hypothetical protein